MVVNRIEFITVQSQAPIHPLYHPHLQTASGTELDLAPSSSFASTCKLLLIQEQTQSKPER
ncbi:hypothetical protein OIU77_017624 [Salix suchowensis]|uniref:Uncharacterized protein n=2 Tax=Salix TaxID=40685 RepID=A0A9Q1AP34_9ROSI|nr:hypothetical protein OIU77_017624 [Salix suchowensis]KAJ6778408.1 hypothetical protein OIU74_002241 [Salix koriyanagi]